MAEQEKQATSSRPKPRQAPDRGAGMEKATEDTPLTALEQKFVTNYIRCGVAIQALKDTGLQLDNDVSYRNLAYRMLKQPNIKAEINRVITEELKPETVATAEEVMTYFTSVMRGEVKDQFGLEAPLSERTRAAQELAKRTIDIQNRKEGNADQVVAIKLDWSRDK